jgi:uncharacterized protein with GYD domain
MFTFFMFGKFSSEAMKGMSAERTKKAADLVKKFKGEIHSAYALLGEYDLVIIASFPGIQEAMQTSVALSKLTNISFSTSPAVSVEQFDKIIKEV